VAVCAMRMPPAAARHVVKVEPRIELLKVPVACI
jgi:hypothetical protein